MAITLYDNDSDAALGVISENDLQFLIDNLEEETSDDRDYYLRPETVAMLGERQGSPALMELLQAALGDREGIEIRWQRGD
jgi:processive 1,2-diacylglycerol beta-glucosyltransferase